MCNRSLAKRRQPSRAARRRGANVVEFALILPVFMALLASTIDLGWFFFQYSGMTSAVLEGCRRGAIEDPGDPTNASAEVVSEAITLAAENATIDALAANAVQCNGCSANANFNGAAPMRSITCSLTNTFDPLFGLTTSQTTVTVATARRLEWQR